MHLQFVSLLYTPIPIMKRTMKNKIFIMSLAAASILMLSSCTKNNVLVGTSWICEQDQSELFFESNSSGCYSWLENKEIEAYDFTYNYLNKEIVIEVSFPGRSFVMTGTVDGDDMHLGGKEIPLDYHKSK